MTDFVPDQFENAKKRNLKPFESFSTTMAKVNAWIAEKPSNINIVNVQSIDYKVTRKRGRLRIGPVHTVRFLLIATAIHPIATNGWYRTLWKCSHYATATTSPDPTQPIVSKTKSQS